jgi:hypothetical protein
MRMNAPVFTVSLRLDLPRFQIAYRAVLNVTRGEAIETRKM